FPRKPLQRLSQSPVTDDRGLRTHDNRLRSRLIDRDSERTEFLSQAHGGLGSVRVQLNRERKKERLSFDRAPLPSPHEALISDALMGRVLIDQHQARFI